MRPGWVVRPPRFVKIEPSDNIEMLRRLLADPLGIKTNKIEQVHGVVSVMESAHRAAPMLPADTPMLLTYGAEKILSFLKMACAEQPKSFLPTSAQPIIRMAITCCLEICSLRSYSRRPVILAGSQGAIAEQSRRSSGPNRKLIVDPGRRDATPPICFNRNQALGGPQCSTTRPFDNHEGVHLFSDPASGLKAIIAVHSTALGPSSGGTRMWDYPSSEAMLTDALRLSQGMSYKNAMASIPHGGGKAVIWGNSKTDKSEAMFRAVWACR